MISTRRKSGLSSRCMRRAVADLPKGDEWLYEIKLDGYRCLAGRNPKGVTLWSRRANLFTTQFPTIARPFDSLASDTLVDGEVVAIDENGRVSFNLIQHHRSKARAIQFYAFDILIYRGRSLLSVPLEDRRQLLRNALNTVGDPIRYSDSFEAAPDDLIAAAKLHGCEGIIAKRKDSLYQPGKRSRAWLKYKINSHRTTAPAARAYSPAQIAAPRIMPSSKALRGIEPRSRVQFPRLRHLAFP
jgi:bifunctional non-homologous end joining protein LigD